MSRKYFRERDVKRRNKFFSSSGCQAWNSITRSSRIYSNNKKNMSNFVVKIIEFASNIQYYLQL